MPLGFDWTFRPAMSFDWTFRLYMGCDSAFRQYMILMWPFFNIWF